MIYGCDECGGNYNVFNSLCEEGNYIEASKIVIKESWFDVRYDIDDTRDNLLVFSKNLCNFINYMKETILHLENRPPVLHQNLVEKGES